MRRPPKRRLSEIYVYRLSFRTPRSLQTHRFRHGSPAAPKHAVSRPKFTKTRSSTVNTKVTAASLDPKNKKARQTLAGLSGYLARAKPASSMVRQSRKRHSLDDN